MSISIVTTVPFSVNGEESSGNTAETVSEETKNLNVGDIIEFGSYPQKQVTDTELISKLNDIDAPRVLSTEKYFQTNQCPVDMVLM